jgi:hypothetical protein
MASELQREGRSVWFDRDLPAHRPYTDVIDGELTSAAAVLVLWSKASAQSEWVRAEANRAREMHKLVQARIGNVRLPLPFDQIQCADLASWRGSKDHDGWLQIKRSILALLGDEPDHRQAVAPPGSSRRIILGGAGALALAAGGGLYFWRSRQRPESLSPEASLLLQKGMDTLQQNDALDAEDPGSTLQAIALLGDATRAAPQSPTAWGGLAMALAVRHRVAPIAEREGLAARARSAAATALRLDPEEIRALAAQRMLVPVYRNWATAERGDREVLARVPKAPILFFLLSDLLGNVGRWRDAAGVSTRFDRTKFLIPGADRKVAIDLWCAGDLQAADDAIALAVQHWPQHPQVWRTRVAYLMYSGRAGDALNLLTDSSQLPPDVRPDLRKVMSATAGGLAGNDPPQSAVASNLAYLKTRPEAALPVAQACAALGDPDRAFDILNGYYFGEGEWASVAPKAGDRDRSTSRLFQPPARRLWADPRFATLTGRIGLDDYWRQSGTRPDFRRGAQ